MKISNFFAGKNPVRKILFFNGAKSLLIFLSIPIIWACSENSALEPLEENVFEGDLKSSFYSESSGYNPPASQISCYSLPGSFSEITVNRSLVEKPSYGNRSFDTDFFIHDLCSSKRSPSGFYKSARWYQQDHYTQIFRIFPNEQCLGCGRVGAARIEAFSDDNWVSTSSASSSAWKTWTGRVRIVKGYDNIVIFQVKNNTVGYEWPLQIRYDKGNILAIFREYNNGSPRMADTVVLTTIPSFDLKIRDNGYVTKVYINGVQKAVFSKKRPTNSKNSFRWGIYMQKYIPNTQVMIFVSGAKF